MCHCGRSENFAECCGRYLDGDDAAASAETLMRSRYSAFVVKNYKYLHLTQDPQTRSPADSSANEEFSKSVEFTGLEVLNAQEAGNKARVEFIAHYRDLKSGEAKTHHELSQFRKQAGVWYYRQGQMKN